MHFDDFFISGSGEKKTLCCELQLFSSVQFSLSVGSLSWGTGESRLGTGLLGKRSWHRKVNDRTKIDSPEEDSD